MRLRALGLAAAVVAGVTIVSASGAATTKAQRVTRIDVSTRAAVIHYLHSIHVRAKGAVIERGGRNYAGAHCPGRGWTCASTRHTVVQISKQGGSNRFVCRSARCVVVQLSGVSHGVYIRGRKLASSSKGGGGGGSTATCVKTGSGATTGSGQTCTISQSGSGQNTAGVYENTQKVSGLVQTAQYTASITQQSSGPGNIACVTQNISLDGSTSNTNGKQTTANLQAHQSILITQDATGTGTNSAQYAATSTGACASSALSQSQTLTSTVTATGPITQNEDASFNPCGDNVAYEYANLCLDIEQNQHAGNGNANSGTNTATFTQTSTQTEIANHAGTGQVLQQQSTPLCGTSGAPTNCTFPGGLVGTINQDSSRSSSANATQVETQCQDAARSGLTTCRHDSGDADFTGSFPLIQNQYGPEGVGKLPYHGNRRVPERTGKGLGLSRQTNGTGNSFQLSQTSTQDNDHLSAGTQLNSSEADCDSSNGSCTAGQTTTVNNTSTSDGYTAPSIGQLQINCPKNQACAGTPPPDPTFVSGPTSPNYSSSAAFNFNDSPVTKGVSFLCKIDGGTAQEVIDPCSPNTAFSQGYGSHTFQVAATDAYGNVSDYVPATPFGWTNVVPAPVIDSGPANGSTTESKTANFTFHDSDSSISFVCSQDGTTYTACSPTAGPGSGEQDYAGPLDLGTQNFYVEATDGEGHFSSPATVQWTILPTCDAGTGSSQAAYNAMPLDVTHCGPASEGFEADADNEFGDEVTLDTTGGTSLQSLTVDLQSYGCGDGGNWYSGISDPCATTSGETFTIPGGITATIYSVNHDGSVGPVLATSTIHPQIPYRPSADPTDCPGGVSGVEAGSQWYDPLAQACRYSVSDLVRFTNWSANPTFTNGEPVIWTVQFNTTHAGYTPIGENSACFTSPVGCGYDSLNVGATSFPKAPYAGTDANDDQAFLSWDDGYGGTVNPLQAQPGWTSYRPLGEIILGTPPAPQ